MRDSICSQDTNLRGVLEAINADPAGTSFITNPDQQLVGILTDGDFRRMLLAGRSLEDPLMPSDLKPFIAARKGESMEEIMKRTDKRVRIVPIIADNGRMLDYFRYEHKTHFTPVAEPSLSDKELQYLTDAFLSTWISSRGKYIDRFEADFAEFCQCPHGVATANGTVALHLALAAWGIGPGDEVIVPDLTFAATINAVLYTGATPVIVDVERDRWTLCPAEFAKAVTPNTKAVIPVHVYGMACRMDAIMEVADKHGIKVLEDCAEAHGATFKGKRVGSWGHAGTFSFFANKIITTGEGGMVVTRDPELDARMRVLRDHGMKPGKRYWHDEVGYNYRMTNLQAAIGCAQLERIDEIIAGHAALEKRYMEALADFSVTWPTDFDDSGRVIWLISVLVEQRDAIMAACKDRGVDVRPFFYPLSTMPAYEQYAFSGDNARWLAARGLNLPTVDTVDLDRIQEALQQPA